MDLDDKKFYAERLEALWGKYLQFVNFVVSLSGGTVLILLAKLIEPKVLSGEVAEVPSLLWWALLVSGAAAIYSIFWRALAQRYMEYEVLAPFLSMEEYIGKARLQYTSTNVHRFEGPRRIFMKRVYAFAPWAIAGGLLISWSLVGAYLSTLLV